MIEQQNGIEIICDGCDESELLKGYEFLEAIKRIKQLGWKIVKEDGEWMHYCPECKRGLE